VNSPACRASYSTGTTGTGTPSVSIRKFAGSLDSQTLTGAYQTTPGSSFDYSVVVTNTGTVAATGVVVTDTFPQYISLGTITPPAGWTCNTGTRTQTGITYPTVICTTPTLAAGATVTITIPSTLSAITPSNAQLRNIVYVCTSTSTGTNTCNPTCTDPNNPSCNPPPPPPNCDPIPGSPNCDTKWNRL
jgi:uncharacterized repeat protein (TIGR01451 family)